MSETQQAEEVSTARGIGNERCRVSGAPLRTVEDIRAWTPTDKQLDVCIGVENAIECQSGIVCILGPTGVGKTMLAVNVCHRWARTVDAWSRYATWNDVVSNVRHRQHVEHRSERDSIAVYSSRRDNESAHNSVLIIDELDAGRNTDDEQRLLECIVGARFNNNAGNNWCQTILIANSSPDRLRSIVGDRLWSRIGGNVYELTGSDRRIDGTR